MKNKVLLTVWILLILALAACSAPKAEHGEVLVYAAPT